MSAEALVTPDAVGIIVDYLNALVTPPVAYAVPKDKPAEFVSLAVTGGAGRHALVLQDVAISVDCWAETARDALLLANLVEGHLLAARFNLPAVYNAYTYGAPADFPDPVSGKPRARATYSLTFRAAPLT